MNGPASTPGNRLKDERETRGLSAQKAADNLHLDAWVIDALEAGDYPRIGPTVYAKGHLKRYAAFLELPAAEILAAFDAEPKPAISNAAVAPSMLLSSRPDNPVLSNLSPSQIIGGIAAVAVALGVFWWRPWQQRGASSSAPLISNHATPGETPRAEPLVANSDAASSVSGSAADADASSTDALGAAGAVIQATSSATAAVAAGAGRARLRMSFSANSWVEVHDADGRLAYSGNGMANSVKTIAGVAPLHVYLGAASGVQLEINGRAVAIGPQFFSGNVARFEAGADGVLRRDAKPDAGRGEAPRLSHAGSPSG